MPVDATAPSPKPSQAAPREIGWRDVLRALRRPKVALNLLLGFASGLPFFLVGNTLGYWLREEGIALSAIGALSWVGLAYSFKFLWAPVVDKVDAPLLGRLFGRRRGWLIASQLCVAIGLAGMALMGPGGGLGTLAAFALLTAFASATQDIVFDAWRIESAADTEELALVTAACQLGYRAGVLCADSLILLLAGAVGWSLSYAACAAAMTVGIVASLLAVEPPRPAAVAGSGPLWTPRGLFDAVLGPFIEFFRRHGQLALLMLAAVSLYRLPDFVMGPMVNPLYVDVGLTKETVGAVRASVGLWATLVGVALGGLSAVRLGFTRTLILGAVLGPLSNLGFSAMALVGTPATEVFVAVIIVDNVSTGFAGIALVTYMSSLTSIGYTATQYALLTSFYALLGKVLKGFSGGIVEALSPLLGAMGAYAAFFAGTAAVGLPAVLLCLFLERATRRRRPGNGER